MDVFNCHCVRTNYSVWVLDWFYKERGDDLKNNGLRHVGKCLNWFWKILSVTQSHHGNDPAIQWAYRTLWTSRRLRKLDTDEDLNRWWGPARQNRDSSTDSVILLVRSFKLSMMASCTSQWPLNRNRLKPYQGFQNKNTNIKYYI